MPRSNRTLASKVEEMFDVCATIVRHKLECTTVKLQLNADSQLNTKSLIGQVWLHVLTNKCQSLIEAGLHEIFISNLNTGVVHLAVDKLPSRGQPLLLGKIAFLWTVAVVFPITSCPLPRI